MPKVPALIPSPEKQKTKTAPVNPIAGAKLIIKSMQWFYLINSESYGQQEQGGPGDCLQSVKYVASNLAL